MPTPGKLWIHLTIGTHNSWLPGDERGFRSRNHKIHSSGDHRNPPPKEEHQGLRNHWKKLAKPPVIIPVHLRRTIGKALVKHFQHLGHRVLILGAGGMHVHAIVELPRDRKLIRREVGRCKRIASLAVRQEMPGRVWARLPGIKPVRSRNHLKNAYNYILEHEGEGAYVWTEREDGKTNDA